MTSAGLEIRYRRLLRWYPAARQDEMLGVLMAGAEPGRNRPGLAESADLLLGEHPEDHNEETVDLWLEVQLAGRAYLHYWRNEPEAAAAVLARARPVVEARGTPARRQG